MFTARYLNNALNSIHERALRLIYNDYELPFDRILEDNKQKSIHQKNIGSLAIGIYKFQAGLTPPIIGDLFVTRENNYNIRNFQELESPLRRVVKFGTKTISNRGPQICNLIPERLRTLETLNKFKKEIKSWKCLSMYKVQNVHSTCWLYQLRVVMYFLSDTVTLIALVFPFLLTETSH